MQRLVETGHFEVLCGFAVHEVVNLKTVCAVSVFTSAQGDFKVVELAQSKQACNGLISFLTPDARAVLIVKVH